MSEYLFNVFLLSYRPVIFITILFIICVLPGLHFFRKHLSQKKEKSNLSNFEAYVLEGKPLKKYLFLIWLVLCSLVILMASMSPQITPKNVTFNRNIEIERIMEQRERDSQLPRKEITLEGARVLEGYKAEDKKFDDMVDYSKKD